MNMKRKNKMWQFVVSGLLAFGVGLQLTAGASNLPQGYRQIAYVEARGQQWLDTGYLPNPSTIFVLDMQVLGSFRASGAADVLGCAEGDYVFEVNYGAAKSGDDLYIWTDKKYEKGGAVESIAKDVNKVNGQRADFSFDSTTGKFTYGNLSRICTTPSTTFTRSPIRLCGLYGGEDEGTYKNKAFSAFEKMRVFSFKIWSGEKLERYYVPCVRESDGVAGLYDKANGEFKPSDGEPFFAAPKDLRLGCYGFVSGESNAAALDTGFAPLLSDFSAGIWVKNVKAGSFNGSGSNPYLGSIITQGALSANDGFACYVMRNYGETTERLVFQTRKTGNVIEVSADWSAQTNDDKWHYLALTYTCAKGLMRLYVDGVCVGEETRADKAALASAQNLVVGARTGAGSNTVYPMCGNFGEISIWNRVLSKNEIKRMLYGPLSGRESGLVGYWPISDTSHFPVAPDLVANGNTPHPATFKGDAKIVKVERIGFWKKPGMALLLY